MFVFYFRHFTLLDGRLILKILKEVIPRKVGEFNKINKL